MPHLTVATVEYSHSDLEFTNAKGARSIGEQIDHQILAALELYAEQGEAPKLLHSVKVELDESDAFTVAEFYHRHTVRGSK